MLVENIPSIMIMFACLINLSLIAMFDVIACDFISYTKKKIS